MGNPFLMRHFIYRYLIILMCAPTILLGGEHNKIIIYLTCSALHKKQCARLVEKAQDHNFIKPKTNLLHPNEYHMSLLYATTPYDQGTADQMSKLAKHIRQECRKAMPRNGLRLDAQVIKYWGRSLVIKYESRDFKKYHQRVSAAVKDKFPDVSVAYDNQTHEPHVTAGRLKKCSKNWKNEQNELNINELKMGKRKQRIVIPAQTRLKVSLD